MVAREERRGPKARGRNTLKAVGDVTMLSSVDLDQVESVELKGDWSPASVRDNLCMSELNCSCLENPSLSTTNSSWSTLENSCQSRRDQQKPSHLNRNQTLVCDFRATPVSGYKPFLSLNLVVLLGALPHGPSPFTE